MSKETTLESESIKSRLLQQFEVDSYNAAEAIENEHYIVAAQLAERVARVAKTLAAIQEIELHGKVS